MANQKTEGENPATERDTAPATVTPVAAAPRYVMPHEYEVERVGNLSSGVTIVFPEVRGGVCEWCGVIDGNYPSQYQYKLCPHYRGKQLSCSYCPAEKDVDDVINHSVLRIMQHPDHPKKLLIHCNSYNCLRKHEQRWKIANS
jgi:hypothetical protein